MSAGRSEATLVWSALGRVRGFRASVFPPHGSSFQGDAVGVMDEAVQDGIGKGGVPDDLMPGVEGELAGDEGRATAVAVLEHFEEIPPFGVGERCQTEVVEDEQVGAGESVQLLGIRSVRPPEGEIVEESG